MTREDFDKLIRIVTADIAGMPIDLQLEAHLHDRFPIDGTEFSQINEACRDGIKDGWLCDRDGLKGIRYSRPIQPGPATAGFSVDVVLTGSLFTPKHRHPKGEIDMIMPVTSSATFDGCAKGWAVYGPGSVHEPPVAGGDIIILYLLPDGAIEFLEPDG